MSSIFKDKGSKRSKEEVLEGKVNIKFSPKKVWEKKKGECVEGICNHDCTDKQIQRKIYKQLERITELLEIIMVTNNIKVD